MTAAICMCRYQMGGSTGSKRSAASLHRSDLDGGGGCGDVLSSIAVLSAKHEMEVGCPVMIEGGGGIPVHPYMVPEGPPPLSGS